MKRGMREYQGRKAAAAASASTAEKSGNTGTQKETRKQGKRREEDVERKERRLTRQRERTTDRRFGRTDLSLSLVSVSCLFSSCCLPFSPVSFLSTSCRAVYSVLPVPRCWPAAGQKDSQKALLRLLNHFVFFGPGDFDWRITSGRAFQFNSLLLIY